MTTKSSKRLPPQDPKLREYIYADNLRRSAKAQQLFEARIAEMTVALHFQELGYRWTSTRQSRGPADILAWHPKRKLGYAVQVKSRHAPLDEPFIRSMVSPKDRARLRSAARLWKFRPAIARVHINSLGVRIQLDDADGRIIWPSNTYDRAKWQFEVVLTDEQALKYLGRKMARLTPGGFGEF